MPVDTHAPLGSTSSTYEVEEPGALGVLRNRQFLALWLSQASTQVGGNMVLYGLTVHIAGLSPVSNYSAVSILFLCFLLPPVIVSPIAGVVVDRLDRRLLLVVNNGLRAAAFVGILLAGDFLPAIYVLSIAVSTASTFFAPAEAAMIPQLVPRQQLTPANGLFLFTINASFGLGFAVFGPLLRVVAGYDGLVLVVAFLYAAAALFCLILPGGGRRPSLARAGEAVHEAESAVASLVGELRDGLAYIAGHRAISWSIVYLALASSLIGVLGVLGPGFARNSLGLTEESFVVIIVPLFAGLITAVLLLNQYGRYIPRRRLIEGALLALAVLLGFLSVAGPIARFLHARAGNIGAVDLGPYVSLLSIVVVIAFVAGMAYASIAIPAQTQLQEELPEDVRGRVFGVLNMLISLAALLPIVLVGPFADVFGVEAIMIGAGVATGLVGVASIMWAHPPQRVSAAPRGEHAPVDPVTVTGTTSLLRAGTARERRGGESEPDRADSWREAAHLLGRQHPDHGEERPPEEGPPPETDRR